MNIQQCTLADFGQILNELSDFWGSDRTLAFHHPMFLYEFGNTAFVIKEGGKVVAYLFGFLSQTENCGYVHLVGVRADRQKQGLGRRLYGHFIEAVKQKGAKKVKTITTPENGRSIAFHQKIGMKLLGEPSNSGVRIIRDYSGSGQDRAVFEMDI